MPEWRPEIRARLASLRLRPEREIEIVEEIAQHLEDRYGEMRAAGKDDADAAAAAWRELEANDVLTREVARSERSAPLELPPPGAPAPGRWLAALWQDCRYAARSLRQQPMFTATILIALALSIGPVTAIVSLGNWLFWRPVPGVSGADRLGLVWFGQWRGDGRVVSVSPSGLSRLNLADLRTAMKSATGFAGVQESSASLIVGESVPRVIPLAQVTGDFFEVLGVRAAAGRTFSADEDRPPLGAPVAVVSAGLATTEFGSLQAAIGRRLTLDRKPFTVIGVAPPAFGGITNTSNVNVWITGATGAYLSGRGDDGRPENRSDGMFYLFVARLAPAFTFSQFEAELGALTRGLADAHPQENAKYREVTARVFPRLGLEALMRPRMQSTLNVLLAMAGLLLLLGCANVANMLIARAIRREPEAAIRQALGASGRRLLQLQLVESCLLAVGGATLGIGLAVVLKQIIQQLLFPPIPGQTLTMPIDLRVLTVTLGAALATGTIAGLAPGWLISRTRSNLIGAIGRSGAGRTTTRAPRLRSGLAVAQLALSLTLLVGALLLVSTLRNLRAVDLGFNPANLTVMTVDLGAQGYTPDRAVAFHEQLHRALNEQPSFQAATISFRAPFGASNIVPVLPPGVDSSDQALRTVANGVSHTYFATISTSIVRGRAFTADEAFAATPVETMPVIVSQALARRLFGDGDPLTGRVRLQEDAAGGARELPIVGVAQDAHWNRVTGEPELLLYQPLVRHGRSTRATVIVRSAEPAPVVTAAVRAVAARLDRAVPLTGAQPLSAAIDRSLQQQRLFATMLGWISVLAFVLAAVGLHGLVSQATTERTREFGIRLALGAKRADIVMLIAQWVFVIAGLGTVAGLVLAAFGTSLVKTMLFGVTPLEPAVYALAVVALTVVVIIASAWPALRATRVQPVDVLRAE